MVDVNELLQMPGSPQIHSEVDKINWGIICSLEFLKGVVYLCTFFCGLSFMLVASFL